MAGGTKVTKAFDKVDPWTVTWQMNKERARQRTFNKGENKKIRK